LSKKNWNGEKEKKAATRYKMTLGIFCMFRSITIS